MILYAYCSSVIPSCHTFSIGNFDETLFASTLFCAGVKARKLAYLFPQLLFISLGAVVLAPPISLQLRL
ncbi:hypothetical protein CMV_011706 [Castanea mollissima]|uniref:Uncharacterized protein n=1 Tax=Castanea mollissima TaxID=60419 RepID=A0A8J4VWQ5_9ROSI|nr:hypothetical protein CMV_011706 [Castanea mollissima]